MWQVLPRILPEHNRSRYPNTHNTYDHNAADDMLVSLSCSYYLLQVILISSRRCLVITKTTEFAWMAAFKCHKLLSRMNLSFFLFNYFPGPETSVLWNFVQLNMVLFYFIRFNTGLILESN